MNASHIHSIAAVLHGESLHNATLARNNKLCNSFSTFEVFGDNLKYMSSLYLPILPSSKNNGRIVALTFACSRRFENSSKEGYERGVSLGGVFAVAPRVTRANYPLRSFAVF